MPISASAHTWFNLKFVKDHNKSNASKYYTKEEPWPKIPVWWLKIPAHAINDEIYEHVDIISQVSYGANFHK